MSWGGAALRYQEKSKIDSSANIGTTVGSANFQIHPMKLGIDLISYAVIRVYDDAGNVIETH